MKRLSVLLSVLFVAGTAMIAAAGDYHYGTSLICSDCHTAHYSQQHGYAPGNNNFTPLGAGGPFVGLLRDDENKLCLSCHNNQGWAPDVFGANGGTARLRQAGGLNIAAGHGISNDPGYDEIDGHTLYSTATPPGGNTSAYVVGPEGLVCSNCHGVHGSAVQYRNMQLRGIFAGDTVSYAIGTNDLSKAVLERVPNGYAEGDVDFNEPDVRNSAYGKWCQNCHTDFHGQSGDANMGDVTNGWKRHPVADVNMTGSTLSRWAGKTNKLKVMDSQGLWTGVATDNTLTPSCFTCHKGHGNMNSFGLIFMNGTGTRTEEGDGGQFRDMCRQCHGMGGPI